MRLSTQPRPNSKRALNSLPTQSLARVARFPRAATPPAAHNDVALTAMIELSGWIVGAVALAVAGYAWWHAAKWAKLIAYARIVIEYKGKVKIDAPLREWALWCQQTGKDKSQAKAMRGHVMYVMGGTRIALFVGKKPPKVKPLKSRPGGPQPIQSQEGTWAKSSESKS